MSFFLPRLTTAVLEKTPEHASDEYRTIFLREGESHHIPGVGNIKVPMTGYWSRGNRNIVWLGEDP